MPDRAFYEAMSRDQLVARLKVAEDALVLIGWSSTRLGYFDSPRSKAAEQMWHLWCSMVGGPGFCDPASHADLDSSVPQLAAQRDRIQSETLAKIERLICERGPDG